MEASRSSLPPFDTKDTSSIATRWKKWKRSLELFLEVNSVALASRKRSYLLHYAGPAVQDIFYELEGHDAAAPMGSDIYREAIKLLDNYFAPMASIPYDRFVFRSIRQKEGETVDQFASRLREQGRLCDYGDALDMRITEQIFDHCRSEELREVILKKKLMTVNDTLEEARMIETVHRNKELMAKENIEAKGEAMNHGVENLTVNRIKTNNKSVCFRCGLAGHFANNKACPAKNKSCDRCNIVGHFKKMCKTKNYAATKNKKHDKILMVADTRREPVRRNSSADNSANESDSDVCHIYATNEEQGYVTCTTGGVKLNWVIDSGAHVNVISRNTWDKLKRKGCQYTAGENPQKSLRVYGGGELKVHKIVNTEIATDFSKVNHKIYVVDQPEGVNLLSKQTSIDLGILEIRGEISNVSRRTKLTVGKLKNVQVEVKIDKSVAPVQQPCRRLPIPLQKSVEDKLQELLDHDIIEPAPLRITWASPLVVTPKNGGKNVRICVDMRQANRAIIPDRHPLPTFEEIMPHLDGCRFFSKIDLVQAFHQIELSPESREITTFVTPNAYYRYKRLMFGMNCAAELFKRQIERVLQGLPGTKVFIDDVLVYAATKQEHNERVEAVFKRLEEHGLTVNEDKCEIGKETVNFMGHTLSSQGIRPTNEKVSAVQAFRQPQDAKEMRSFLGLVNYLGKFVPNLSTISAPLREMTVKGTKFHWSEKRKSAFKQVKAAISNPKYLGYYSPNNPTTLVTDASDCGLGAVLLQTVNNIPRVISFASKTLSPSEKKYPTLDKEALGIVWATERFQMYLRGLHFTILTDHKPLVNIFSETSTPNQRQERWVLRMQSFRYTIRHVPGELNIADPLSRLSELLNERSFDGESEKVLNAVVEVNRPSAITFDEIVQYSQEDPETQQVKGALHSDNWNEATRKYVPFKSELCFAGEVLLRKNKIVIPNQLRKTVLKSAHTGHPGQEKMKRRLRVAVWWPGIDSDVKRSCNECFDCQLVATFEKPEPLRMRELPRAPWIHLAGDFLGPLPNGYYLFVLIDLYSRYMIVEPMKQKNFERGKPCFEGDIYQGLPQVIPLDNAMNFSSQLMKDFCVDRGIKLTHTTPYWPSANGEAERQNQSLLKVLRISKNKGTDWKDAIHEYLYMYSITPHSITGVAPAELMFGRRFRDLIPHLQETTLDDSELRDRDWTAKYQAKENRDKRVGAKESSVDIGDRVLMKNMLPQNKLSSKFLAMPATVIDRIGNSVTLQTAEGQMYKRNTSHVKPLNANTSAATDIAPSVIPEATGATNLTSDARPHRETRFPKRFDDYLL
ncbi:uncharacterized protein K02A2.6-like [Armigeres subalbatus]|uniref:uncharacterized protein K02A2.6-like n=1 Tax=Armigeres subalbatus TaxID=124917 RepID=UPI002ED188EC